MEEQTVWKGNSSQVINLSTYAVCVILMALIVLLAVVLWIWLLVLLVVPLGAMFWNWLENKCRVYEVTNERIRLTRGVLSKRTDELELYRVKDTTLVEPFLYRLAGAGNVEITTLDPSTPTLNLEAIKHAGLLREELRKHIEACRDRKRVRVAELDEPNG